MEKEAVVEFQRLYSAQVQKLEQDSRLYHARQPAASAKDSKQQKNRENAIRAYRFLLAEIEKPVADRDPVAQLDIESFYRRWLAVNVGKET